MPEYELWIEQAIKDYKTGELLQKNKDFNPAAFYYQQAGEKSLKSLLIKKKLGIPKTHDCYLLAKYLKAPVEIIQLADSLSAYYYRTRYPDTMLVALTKNEIENIRKNAQSLIAWIQKNL